MTERDPSGDRERIVAAREEVDAIPPLPDSGEWIDPDPDRFPGYRIVGKIHQGAQGVVFRGVQESTRRNVAIKVLHEGACAGADDRARFEREIRILGQIDHPNIVTIHEASVSSSGTFWFVMDYIRGQPLDQYMAGGDRSISETLELFARIAEGVNAAHLKGIIHRDLKPSNIRINSDGEPSILDFGLAKVTSTGSEATVMTHTGKFIGSLPWASPEQAEGDPAKIDTRTDVYALGAVLYQMLTGKLPHDVTGNLPEALQQILNREPIPPRRIEKAIDGELETIVLKCLAKDRERRYQTAGEVARDVRRYLTDEPIEAKRDSAWYVLRKIMGRHRVSTGIAATFLLAGVAFGAVMAGLYRDARAEADTAGLQAAQALDEVERFRSQYQGLLASLDRNRVDLGRDDLTEILQKQDAMKKVLARFSDDALSLMVPETDLGADHIRFLNAASPRLTGRVHLVGPSRSKTSLQDARTWLKPGDTVLLDAGSYALPRSRRSRRQQAPLWMDVAVIGAGTGQTVLTGEIEEATRLRIEKVRVDCRNRPLTNLRRGGCVVLRDCTLSNYNSGAGGSSAVNGSGTVFVVDGCTFEGLSGRAVARGSGGNAFDLRGPNFLWVHKTRFVDNHEIERVTFLAIFDTCTSTNSTKWDSGITPYPSSRVLLRDNQVTIAGGRPSAEHKKRMGELAFTTDDPAFIRAVLGLAAFASNDAKACADRLGLKRRLAYWIGLLRHHDAGIRTAARAQVATLTGDPVKPVSVDSGLDQQFAALTGLPLSAEVECADLFEWYEKHRDQLDWREDLGRYVLKP